MDAGRQHQSHLFTVRMWLEELGDDRAEWRGQLQHVLSGETHYFREWSSLITLLRAMLPPTEITPSTDAMQAGLDHA